MTAGLPVVSEQKAIFIHNAFIVRQLIRVYDSTVDKYVPWVGGSPRVRFSTQPTGYTALGVPSTIVNLGPFNMSAAAGAQGVYFYIVTADLVTNNLASLVATIIYQVVEGNLGSTYYDLTNVQPLLVVDPNAPLPR